MSGFQQSTLIISNICLDLRQFFAKNSFYHLYTVGNKTEQNNSWLELPLFFKKINLIKQEVIQKSFSIFLQNVKNQISTNCCQQYTPTPWLTLLLILVKSRVNQKLC